MFERPNTPEGLFQTYFAPLYPPEAQANLSLARATDVNPGRNPALLAQLSDIAETFRKQFCALVPDIQLDYDDASVHRLSSALTPARLDAWAQDGRPGTADNALWNIIVHGTVFVGACIVHSKNGSWSQRQPLWESVVKLSSRAGEAELYVFQWWLKAVAEAGHADARTLADRYRTHVEVPCMDVDALPTIATGTRKLPRLSKPRYSTLHQYLKAHLPEIKDVGRDFPSPERFDGYTWKWLEGHLVGDGRMLLLAGLGKGGMHMLWLSREGFQKAIHIPCDSFPDPVVRTEGEKIVVLLSHEQAAQRHEYLWWGP